MGREDYSQSIQLSNLSGRLVNRNTNLPKSRNTLLNLIERRIKPNNRIHYGMYPMIQNEYSATYFELLELDLYPPIITITGGVSIDVYQFDAYMEQGAVVDDGSVLITPNLSNVNTFLSPGSTFDIVYHAVDGVGHSNSLTKTATIIASPWTQQAKIQALDIEANDAFGISVSISSDGNTAIVGVPYEDTGGSNAGAAYIFVKSGSNWTQQAKIQALDKQTSDLFGNSTSISSDGNTVIVGAHLEDTGGQDAGAAYIFVRSGSTWSEQAKIQALDKEIGDYFGQSVSISSDGNTAIIGAPHENSGDLNTGAAYIFTRSGSTWSEQAKIVASDKERSDFFGWSVSISGDGNTVIVGAHGEDTGGSFAGAAYIFVRSGSTWSEQTKIQASDKESRDYFGRSVSISSDGNTAIAGASYEDTGGSNAGAAYIFVRSGSTWSEQAKIQSYDKEASDFFGYSVSISNDGNTVIVGAYREGTGGSNAGAAYIFVKWGNFWIQRAKIQASDKEANDAFGSSVSITSDGSNATVIVGSQEGGVSGPGAAYFFTSDVIRSNGVGVIYGDPNNYSYSTKDTTWSEQAKIQALDKEAGDNFGRSVCISSDGRTAIIGVPHEDSGGTDAGAAYIFTRSFYIWSQQAKIQSSDIEAGDNFGQSVSISSDGNTAIVGAPHEDEGGVDAGAAYIFTRSGSTWSEQSKILASDKQPGDYFGESVSISSDGNTAIVGAHGEDTGGSTAGAAYIFTRSGSTWSEQAKIQALDKEADDSFGSYPFLLSDGSSVSISGDGNTVIVAAQLEDTGGQGTGAAYIFVRSGPTWSQQAKIQALDKETGSNFGSSVCISSDGNTVIVGAVLHGTEYTHVGAAYIFTRSGSTWSEQAKIQALDKEADDYFGGSVSISNDGNIAVVGATGKDTEGLNTGATYIFTRSGSIWTQQSRIHSYVVRTYGTFGSSVCVSGDGKYVITGAPYNNKGGTNAGASYIFSSSGFESRIVGPDTSSGDQFGHATAVYGDYVIVGVPNVDEAYIFHRTGTNVWDTGTNIVGSDTVGGDRFGAGVDIYGDYAVVGARSDESMSGSAYIFHRTGTDTWDTGTKIVASGNTTVFGESVAIHGDYVVVGAPFTTGGGVAYVFHRTGTNTWDSGTQIVPPNSTTNGYFGRSVSVYEDYAIVGETGTDSVYTFRRTGTNTWDTGIKLTEGHGDFGWSADIHGDYTVVGSRDASGGGSVSILNTSLLFAEP